MKRVLALVEGQTEETFMRDVLAIHLLQFGVYLTPIVLSTKRVKSGLKFKGGVNTYPQFKRDLRHLLSDRNAVAVTTMLDYYGLPNDFPGAKKLRGLRSCYERAEHLEKSLQDDFQDHRFLPYLSLHEFEALLLTSPDQIARTFSSTSDVPKLRMIVENVDSPEEVNDGPTTHPAARLSDLLPLYKKRLHGPMIVRRIGLDQIRQQCPHFHQWMSRLENLGTG